jgi:hypothetical protein
MEHVASQKTTQAKITPMEDNEPSLEVATVSSVNSFGMFTLKKGKTKMIR